MMCLAFGTISKHEAIPMALQDPSEVPGPLCPPDPLNDFSDSAQRLPAKVSSLSHDLTPLLSVF